VVGGPPRDLLAALRAAVGARHVLTDRDVVAGYETDWTGAYQGKALAVVRPASSPEVAGVVRACADADAPVVVQGGNTGLVGGSVPDGSGRAVVLSTRRLGELGELDRYAGQVTLGAGVALAVARDHARSAGFDMPVDLAARDTATIGGMTATNAGGTHVLRHGTMRRNVVGVEAVLGDGGVISHLSGLEKDNTGYDLAALLCGSEGTLGVVTRIRLRVVTLLPHRVAALLAVPDLDAAVATVSSLRATVGALEAAEYLVRTGLELVMERFGMADPFPVSYPTYLLVEAAGTRDPVDELTAAVSAAGTVLDAAVASSAARRGELWRLRDLHTEAVAAVGRPRKYDVTVSVRDVAAFIAAATDVVAAISASSSVYHWGHLGDGNVHLNVLGLDAHAPGPAVEDLDGAILGLVARFGGSISAEHGIGRLKRPWLHLSRSPSELSAFRAVKRALDPTGILNPGVLLPEA
jgi:FAD/FMN-containing dehydrogenase